MLTAAHVAELLHLNTYYVRRLARDGSIPAHRLPQGRAIRFLRDEVIAWLRALPGPTGQPAWTEEALVTA